MMNRDQVETIRQQLLADGAPKPEIIRQLAVDCLGWPYVFGAWGEECTPAGRKRRARSDHPTIVSACPALNGKSCEVCKWGIGVRMYDCRGFTAWLLRQVGLDLAGQGATSQYNTASNWVRRGPISEMPDCVCCVFKQVNGRTMEHTGMHVGGGEIIHCSRNVQTGSVDKSWTHYAIPAGLYSEGEIPMTNVKPTIRKGATGDLVRELQDTLSVLGYEPGAADGIFGTKTKNAVVAFQTDMNLDPDGVVGPKTWAALDIAEAQAPVAPGETSSGSAEPPSPEGEGQAEVTYRVTIEGVTWKQYRQILNICPLAEAEKEVG